MREDSMRAEQQTQTDYKIYSDGSCIEGGVGTAAVLIKPGQGRPIILHYHLGPETDHITYKAEIVGDLLSVKLAAAIPPNKTATIFTDNQSVLQASKFPKLAAGKYLLQELNRAYLKIRNNGTAQQRCIQFRWISAHSGVEGNELADREAKEAARGNSSRARDLPTLLNKPLPTSSSAVRCNLQRSIKEEWDTARINLP
jgi:ribonuclease HI